MSWVRAKLIKLHRRRRLSEYTCITPTNDLGNCLLSLFDHTSLLIVAFILFPNFLCVRYRGRVATRRSFRFRSFRDLKYMSCGEFIAICLRNTVKTSFLYRSAPDNDEALALITIEFAKRFLASSSLFLSFDTRLHSSVLYMCRRSSPPSKLAAKIVG